MGLLFAEDPHFNENERQTGFYRCRQLLSARFGQNWRDSLIPGTLLGLTVGVYTFMAMLFWWAERSPSLGTVALYLFSLLAALIVNTLYWPQLVLFRQRASIRLRNCLLFCVKYLWRVLGVGILQLGYLVVFVLFAPWTRSEEHTSELQSLA